MGIIYNSKINTDKLVLCLDAGSRKSYPGSGTIWTDVSGQGNNATLTNGPTFDANNAGSIVFDGTNDVVNTSQTINFIDNITVQVWFKWNNVNQLKPIIYIGNSSTNGFGFFIQDTTNSGGAGNRVGILFGGKFYNAINPSLALLTTSWTYLVIVRAGVTYLYQDSVLVGSTASQPNSTSTYSIGGEPGGNIAQALVYNRALSAAEIQQNFNLTRRRFGI